jgi:DNA-directed RNA polymerase subunit RPC12/RpoP
MKRKFYSFGNNGCSDPRQRDWKGNTKCSECGKKFSFWDVLNLSPTDEKYKCAKCKGVKIDLIRK